MKSNKETILGKFVDDWENKSRVFVAIPISERLPNDNELYFVLYDNGYHQGKCLARYDADRELFESERSNSHTLSQGFKVDENGNGVWKSYVTHWLEEVSEI